MSPIERTLPRMGQIPAKPAQNSRLGPLLNAENAEDAEGSGIEIAFSAFSASSAFQIKTA
jgi:hypothetical protein